MILTLCLASALLAPSPSRLPEMISLNGPWRLTQNERKIGIPATVPGVVQLDLMKAGIIRDPYVGQNEKAAQWVGEVPWKYSRSLQISPEFLRKRRIVLRCEGLDTLGRVSINGRQVAQPDNMHRTWEFDAKPFLKPGENTFQIEFEPIEPYLKAHEVQAEFPGKPVQSHGWGYVRKPSFQMGWDFSPKLITAGIWRNIGLVGWGDARLTDVGIVQDHSHRGKVGLDIRLAADVAATTTAHVEVSFKGRKVSEGDASIMNGQARLHLDVEHPKLWWPNEMGPQNLYDVRVILRDRNGATVDRGSRRIGLRTITWFGKTETSPLGLAVNGRRFFAKGSNWVPPDSLLVRTTPEDERKLVQKAVDAHMNLLRLWGGGYYENDSLFDACDEKGILLWFEFKFADATYPAFDPKWLANVEAEARDNVGRVRHHPCIAVYSGNNEVIGFITDKTTPSSMSRDDYNLLFHKTLRDIVHELDPDAFYTPGSPEIGDDHYWDVWHGSATFASYRDRHGFMSEYGFQAFPVPRSVEEFTSAVDRTSVETPVMLNHQRNWRDGNALIVSTLLRYFRRPKDFDSTLWLGQINQADGILTGVEHWRRDWPQSTGSLVWQFNDPWPVVSWSMIDYYGRPKALYYELKHAYASIALSGVADPKSGSVDLWVVNDRPGAKKANLSWTLFKTDGSVVNKGSKTIAAPVGVQSQKATTVDCGEAVRSLGAEKLLLASRLSVSGEPDSTTVTYFVRPKQLDLEAPSIASSVVPVKGGYEVKLSAVRPALWAWIELKGFDAELSDNFVSLMPGSSAVIRVKPATKLSLDQVKKSLVVRSLFDTYLPGTPPSPIVKPGADGRIVATADDAELLGDTIILEVGTPSNIGNWTKVGDALRWTVDGVQPGRYAVTATVGIPANEEGSTFTVEVESDKVSGVVPGTKSWTDYRTISLGTVQIAKGGKVVVNLKPDKMLHEHVMNLRSVVLTPEKS